MFGESRRCRRGRTSPNCLLRVVLSCRWEAVAAAVAARAAELPMGEGAALPPFRPRGGGFASPVFLRLPAPLPCVTACEAALRAWLRAHHLSPILAAGLLSPELFQTVRKSSEKWRCCPQRAEHVCLSRGSRSLHGTCSKSTPASTFFLGIRKSLVLFHFACC